MPKLFKQIKFGLVPITITPPKLQANEQILVSYIKTCCAHSAQYDVESVSEIFNIAKEFIGSSFRLWLIANYKNGSGSRAPLCKAIVHWTEKRLAGRVVIETVRRDMARLDFLNTPQEQIQSPIINNLDNQRFSENVDFSNIKDYHFFEFLALLGPELTAHFCLSLDGIRYK